MRRNWVFHQRDQRGLQWILEFYCFFAARISHVLIYVRSAFHIDRIFTIFVGKKSVNKDSKAERCLYISFHIVHCYVNNSWAGLMRPRMMKRRNQTEVRRILLLFTTSTSSRAINFSSRVMLYRKKGFKRNYKRRQQQQTLLNPKKKEDIKRTPKSVSFRDKTGLKIRQIWWNLMFLIIFLKSEIKISRELPYNDAWKKSSSTRKNRKEKATEINKNNTRSIM